MMTAREKFPLSTGWTFKSSDETSEDAWLPVKSVPTEVHLDLFDNKRIADPFLDLNELAARWVADISWTYRIKFPLPVSDVSGARTDLVLEGLDTFASVSINGIEVLKTDNAFLGHRLKDLGSKEGVDLEIRFESARKKGLELVKEHPEHRFIVHQTEIGRGPVRKAQYHWGWDWGPVLNPCGPWKPVYLETYVSRLQDLWAEYTLNEDLTSVKVRLHATTDGEVPECAYFELIDPSGKPVAVAEERTSQKGAFKADAELTSPQLWWPKGYGNQARYTIKVSIRDANGSILDEKDILIGFRRAELIQEEDSHGKSFYFRINKVDIFAGGSCWIPVDSFVSRISDDKYRDWVRVAAEGNQVMLRVWGGGVYEPDAFYDACDEFGILVWQDFMFACASYPTYPEYLTSVEEEARQNVRRLRNHPSIIIWAGNNEDYQLIERYGLDYPYEEDKDPQSWLKSSFPARYIYEYLLPGIVESEIPGAIYHPSSPWGNGTSTVLKVDSTVGDVHQWNVWHGEMKPYQQLPNMGGRFVSEFGMEAYPHLETIETSITNPTQRYPGSMAMDFRNKAIGHSRRLSAYMTENYHPCASLASFTHISQILQSDSLSTAYKAWRRQWGTKSKRRCGGVLVWQLNDCWPTMSWAVVDYHLIPKPSYYAIRRALAPVAVGVARKVHDWTVREADNLWQRDTAHVDPTRMFSEVMIDVWVASAQQDTLKGSLRVSFVSIRTGEKVRKDLERKVTVAPNGTTEVISNKFIPVEPQDRNRPFDITAADPFVVHVELSLDCKIVSTDTSWPEPIKYLNFEDRGISVRDGEAANELIISTAKPVKGFVFSEKKGIKMSDNGFDLMPWEQKNIFVDGGSREDFAKSWTYIGC